MLRIFIRRTSTQAQWEPVQIPFRKKWNEKAVVRALRSTVPRPKLAIPWAEGIQHDQRLEFTETPWITTQDRATFLQKKDLGRKAAEYVIRQMPAEFGYDMSKGEWGKHDQFTKMPQYFLETPETIIKFPLGPFFEWLFHSPHSFGINETTRYQYPKKNLEDLSSAYCELMEDDSLPYRDEKIYAIVGSMIRSPEVSFNAKVSFFNHHGGLAMEMNQQVEYTELVCDMLDAIYMKRELNAQELSEVPEWIVNMQNCWKKSAKIIEAEKIDNKSRIEKLFKTVKLPNTRVFNGFMRCQEISDPLAATKFARNLQRNMADLGLKLSPASFLEFYRLIDITHRRYMTRQMSEWDFQEIGHLEKSTDFFDFGAYRKLTDIVWKETEKERSQRTGSYNSNQDAFEKKTASQSLQKLIMTNPMFTPRDDFYDIFIKLKNIEMFYSINEGDVWEAFTSSPTQPVELQLTLLRWAEQHKSFNTAARLYQWLDFLNIVRESRSLTNAILVFAERSSTSIKTSGNMDSKESKQLTQMIVISVKELEYVIDRNDGPAGGDANVQHARQMNIVKAAINILMKCDYEPSIREFILSCALDTRKPPLDNEIVAGIMEFAGIRGYMALTEACMRLERSHYEVEISQDLKDKYIGMANSGVNMLTD